MKVSYVLSAVCLFLCLVIAAAPKAENRAGGLFVPLKKGAKVNLKATANGYEIGVVPGMNLGFTITEIGQDYVVLKDLAGVTETRIPVYSIRAIKTTRLPTK
jgi:hypothetical protein